MTEGITLTCRSHELVLFADGIEHDRVAVHWGQDVEIRCAATQMLLAQPPA